ncbi:hypothetical protein Droror1_Dr00009957 [Drosera rotundifolia]
MPSHLQCNSRSQRYEITYLENTRGCYVFRWPECSLCDQLCTIDLWTLREYGNARSWTILLSLRVAPGLMETCSDWFWNGSEIMFIRRSMRFEHELASYDLQNRRAMSLAAL